jgi:hypothetical protein
LKEKFNLPQNTGLENADHVVVSFWNTDMEKGEIEQNWQRFQSYFSKTDGIYFIRIWTDLNEN